MTTLLPKDADNNAIPALRLKNAAAHQIASGVVAAQNAVAFDDETKVIGLYTTEAVFIEFGDASVTATAASHYFPAGVYYDIAITGGTGKGPHNAYISVLSAGTDGTVYISEKE